MCQQQQVFLVFVKCMSANMKKKVFFKSILVSEVHLAKLTFPTIFIWDCLKCWRYLLSNKRTLDRMSVLSLKGGQQLMKNSDIILYTKISIIIVITDHHHHHHHTHRCSCYFVFVFKFLLLLLLILLL